MTVKYIHTYKNMWNLLWQSLHWKTSWLSLSVKQKCWLKKPHTYLYSTVHESLNREHHQSSKKKKKHAHTELKTSIQNIILLTINHCFCLLTFPVPSGFANLFIYFVIFAIKMIDSVVAISRNLWGKNCDFFFFFK